MAQGWEVQQGRLLTPWAQQVDPQNTLPEYPRPQMVRDEWLNLNGLWQYQPGAAGDAVPVGQNLSGQILVPFCVESAISGVMEHHERLWYRRSFEVPAGWQGQRILLHFGAVDWESEIYINGTRVGIHQGGYDAFYYDITSHLTDSGPQEVIVRVFDPTDNAGVPRGKQTLTPGGIMYTSCTGIWQTVWLEPVPQVSITDLRLFPDVDNNRLKVTGYTSSVQPNLTIQATAYRNGIPAGTVSGGVGEELHLMLQNPRLWSPTDPFLYDLTVVVKQGQTEIDRVESYFGMRKVSLGTVDGVVKMLLNNEFVFQMGPLDQGLWPDGIYTAPTDEALKYDIEKTIEMGFNMTRKHIKVEPARWYYWCDKLGLMVWQDMPSLNSYTANPQPIDAPQFKVELERMVQTHWNSPSIIMWVIFNEHQGQHNTEYYVQRVKELDPTRLINQGSGGGHFGVGDVLDIHNYPQPNYPVSETLARACGEYGGIGMQMPGHMWDESNNSWGYIVVDTPAELIALYDSYAQMLSTFKSERGLSAAVYTQITDVEIEINGLMTYDRIVKADPAQIALSNAMSRTYEQVVPTSEQTAQTWRFTTSQPATDWNTGDFDDSDWSQGPGGFGTAGTPGAVVGTEWNSSDIWIRRTVNLTGTSQDQLNNLVLRIHHDEDAQVFINGVQALVVGGYTTSYIHLPIDPAARAAVNAEGDNLIAVHCRQTAGGQYIDVGLALESVDTVGSACGPWGHPRADLTQDCLVNLSDAALILAAWMNE